MTTEMRRRSRCVRMRACRYKGSSDGVVQGGGGVEGVDCLAGSRAGRSLSGSSGRRWAVPQAESLRAVSPLVISPLAARLPAANRRSRGDGRRQERHARHRSE